MSETEGQRTTAKRSSVELKRLNMEEERVAKEILDTKNMYRHHRFGTLEHFLDQESDDAAENNRAISMAVKRGLMESAASQAESGRTQTKVSRGQMARTELLIGSTPSTFTSQCLKSVEIKRSTHRYHNLT